MKHFLFTACVVFALAIGTTAQCKPPRFREGRNFINPESGRGALYISMQPREFTLSNIVCLSQTLRSRHGNWKYVGVLMFGSRDAAEDFQPMGADFVDGAYLLTLAKQLHAMYSFDSEGHEEYIDILPFGYPGSPSADTRIDFPISSTPRCRVELGGRCVITLDGLDYPPNALQTATSGSITLTGRVSRSGELRGVRLLESAVTPKDGTEILASAAIESLSKWRVEAARHEDKIRITYRYTIESSSLGGGKSRLEFDLPNQVIIRGTSQR